MTSRMTRKFPGSNRGVALIAVLWVVLLLSAIAGSLMMLTRTELGLARNLVLSARAEALAEGGIHLAIGKLLNQGAVADGAVWRVTMESGHVDIMIADVTGRVDLNAAPPELIANLLRAAGTESDEAEMLADRIVDWRDADETPRPNGGEQSDYAGYDPPVWVGNNLFLSADEITRVPGVTTALWARIANAVTVYSRRPGVNPLYASRLALLALPGMDEATADAIIDARNATSDDTAGRTPARLAELANLVPAEARRYMTGGQSSIYAVRARAELPEGAVYILETVMEPTPARNPPWRIHEWRPGTPD